MKAGTFVLSALFLNFILLLCALYACKKGTAENTEYYYANWSCGTSTQCASVMGASKGTNGPFCSYNDCNEWKKKYIPGNCTCDKKAANSPVRGGTPPGGRKCFKVGDF
ncbi:MAG: hypothetical protein K2X48_04925 [Chitinophagaceae bacterium]|nr:hypothetical protein [Chitinophagaceae bacterium]